MSQQNLVDLIKSTFLGSDDNSGNVIDLLKADHRLVMDLFKEFESSESSAQRKTVLKKILSELDLHTAAEEKHVYSQLGELDKEGTTEAMEEHNVAKFVMNDLRNFNGSAEALNAKVKVLRELIKHHIREEENNLLPKLKEKELDLNALGDAFEQEKKELQSQAKASEKIKKPARRTTKSASKAKTSTKSAAKKSAAKKTAAKRPAKSKAASSKSAKSKTAKSKSTAKAKTTKRKVAATKAKVTKAAKAGAKAAKAGMKAVKSAVTKTKKAAKRTAASAKSAVKKATSGQRSAASKRRRATRQTRKAS